MNKKLLTGLVFGSFGLVVFALIVYGLIFALFTINIQNRWLPLTAVGFLAISLLLFIVVIAVVHLLTIYKNWNSIQDGQSTVSAGKAVGFLFIPLFNYYWIFKVWGGFPKAYNEFIDRNGLAAPKIESIKTFVLVPLWTILSPLISIIFFVVAQLLIMKITSILNLESAVMSALAPFLIILPLSFMFFPTLMIPFVLAAAVAESCDAVNNVNLAKQTQATGNLSDQTAFITPKKRFLHPILIIGFSLILLLYIICGVGLLIFAPAKSNLANSIDGNSKTNTNSNSKANINSNSNTSTVSANYYQTFPDPNPEKKADFQMSAGDFYKAALDYSLPKSALSKYAGKVIEISGRVYMFRAFDGHEIFLRVPNNGTPAGLELTTGEGEKLKEISDDERLRAKCEITGDSSVELKNCFILERKPIVTLDEPADFTLTAKHYYDEFENTDLSYEKKEKNGEKYFGKILEITGTVKEIGGKKNLFLSSGTNFFSCRTSEKFMSQFDQLKDGQQATFRATHDGIGLTGCIVKP